MNVYVTKFLQFCELNIKHKGNYHDAISEMTIVNKWCTPNVTEEQAVSYGKQANEFRDKIKSIVTM